MLLRGIFLLAHCGISFKSLQRQFEVNPVDVFSDLESAIATEKYQLLFLIYNDIDVAAYDAPITEILKYDATKSDLSGYLSLTQYYSVVKLYRTDFQYMLNNLENYEHWETFKEDAMAYSPDLAFLFICHEKALTLYGEMPLDSPANEIHSLIWGFMGP